MSSSDEPTLVLPESTEERESIFERVADALVSKSDHTIVLYGESRRDCDSVIADIARLLSRGHNHGSIVRYSTEMIQFQPIDGLLNSVYCYPKSRLLDYPPAENRRGTPHSSVHCEEYALISDSIAFAISRESDPSKKIDLMVELAECLKIEAMTDEERETFLQSCRASDAAK